MKDSNEDKITIDEIYDYLDSAAKRYPMKGLAPKVNKAESTLRGELNRQTDHKLSLSTAIMILTITHDLKALDAIESKVGRVAFYLPEPDPGNICDLMCMVSDLTREFSEHMKEVAEAMKDGKVSRSEARKCLKELDDVVAALMKLKGFYQSLL